MTTYQIQQIGAAIQELCYRLEDRFIRARDKRETIERIRSYGVWLENEGAQEKVKT